MELVENIKDYYNEETKVISMPNNNIEISSEGIGYMLFESMKRNFGKTALIDINNNETYSYDDLFLHTIRTAIKLKSMGVKPGDIISICSYNQFDAVATFISICLIGAINATLEETLSDGDFEDLVKQIDPKIFFVSSNCEERFEEIINKLKMNAKIVVYGDTNRNIRYSEFNCHQTGEDVFEPYIAKDVDDMCLILFSSGSTGLPKPLCFPHKFFDYHSGNVIPFEIALTFASLYWIGAVQAVFYQIRNGNKYALASKYDPCALWEAIPKYNMTMVQLYPHIATDFITYKPKDKEVDLKYLAIIGSAMSEENILKMRAAMPKTMVGNVYAMSETAQLANPTCLKSYTKPTSVGIPLKGIQYKVVDIETEQNVGYNQRGELRVKSLYQFKGYYNRDSSECWDEEGFFKTGDVVYYDEDFSIFVVDRIKEMFKCRSIHITPVKYEKILEDHPEINIAIIVGVPNSNEDNDIVAVVVPKKGSSITAIEVEEYYNSKVIDVAKITGGVKFMESLPLSPSGKIARNKLKQMIINEMK